MGDTSYLENLGFSQNEAKVYTALLKNKLLNGYEIAKLSGVSRSLVYEVINRLVGKGVLFRLEGEPSYYTPLEYGKLIERMKREHENNINKAEEYLRNLAGEEESHDYVMNIVGIDKTIRKAAALISQNRRFPEIKRAVCMQRSASGRCRCPSASAPVPPGPADAPDP